MSRPAGITANGEHDAEVQPEGIDNYKFTLDSAAEVAAAAAGLAAGVAGAAEEKEELEDAGDADSELGALDSSDDIDEEEPVAGATLEDVVDEGMELVPERPAVDATLLGKVVAVKWTVVGWCIGRVTKVYGKTRGPNRLNVEPEVGYEDSESAHRFRDVGEGDEKDGGHYATVNGAACGSWVALRHCGGEE